MKELKKEGTAAFNKQFSKWDVTLKEAKVESVEKLYQKLHAEIRKNPDRVKRAAKQNFKREHAKKK